jgi:hypothetical protein
VLFTGITVCIALLGIVVLGLSFLNGLAVASALTVAFTVMPALLGVFRDASAEPGAAVGVSGVPDRSMMVNPAAVSILVICCRRAPSRPS